MGVPLSAYNRDHTETIPHECKLTAVGFQELPGDDNSVEPGCVVEGSKALLVQSIDQVALPPALGAALKKGIQQVCSAIQSNLHV